MILGRSLSARRWIVPEVVQTSGMDCGPASLKALLDGYGIKVSYGRLREACQTDVDGTSIDTLEDVVNQLGLHAEQVMMPKDHLFLPGLDSVPALIVVVLPHGLTHFVVVWRHQGGLVQVMDPATGRRWPSCRSFLSEVFVHTMPVAAESFRQWTEGDEFQAQVKARLEMVGVSKSERSALLSKSLMTDGWRGPASLDAAVRLVDAMRRAQALGRNPAQLLHTLLDRAIESPNAISVPESFWTAQALPSSPDDTEPQVLLRGAVLLRILGKRPTSDAAQSRETPNKVAPAKTPLSQQALSALKVSDPNPGVVLYRLLRDGGFWGLWTVVGATVVSALAVVFEALLFRSLLDIGRFLGPTEQRLAAAFWLLVFVGAGLALRMPIAHATLRLGRHLEGRLRVAFLEKIPRLGDRYFHSRLTSDMADRSHNVHGIRSLASLGRNLLETCFTLIFTAMAIGWMDPPMAPLALLVAALSVVLPLCLQPLLTERDLRVRVHAGTLTKFFLDTLLGLVPIRTHCAERAIRREHESLLVEWARANLTLLTATLWIHAVLALSSLGLCALLLVHYLSRSSNTGSALLLVYWALNLSTLGRNLAQGLRQVPAARNATLRLVEPLGAPEEYEPTAATTPPAPESAPTTKGMRISLEKVRVVAGGHTILEDINLTINEGSHVAIVGPSGAGKSSLVGILLGWHHPSHGNVRIDGRELDALELDRLRRSCAWVDPSVQLWNRSLLSNLRYGSSPAASLDMEHVLDAADLRGLLATLDDGYQTSLGEGGALVSGGEGQRVRLGRALAKRQARLVILDEPFRGLDREKRRLLLNNVRKIWANATLLCITHDVGETLGFPRVVVIEDGHVVDDGSPTDLQRKETSRYRTMLQAEHAIRQQMWAASSWRHLWLDKGTLTERDSEARVP